jgi:copper transport outer membrane protein MctB
MIDFRYHALSLAAVLFALVLGVLLGVAIGDTNLVSSAKNGVVHDLQSEVGEARSQLEKAQDKLGEEEAFAKGLYPLSVHELLAGRNIGLVFLGSSSDKVNSLVRAAVTQSSGQLAMVVAVREPIDASALARDVAGTSYAAIETSNPLLERFGELVGRQLVSGGADVEHELISRVRAPLLSAFDGQLTRLEGLVVMRADPPGMSSAESEQSDALDSGLIAGANAVGIPTVGVELTSTEPSQIPWYQGRKISSVDDLDAPAGQAALIYALAGSRGDFGIKSTADSLLPTVSTSATSSTATP